jgi:regulator of protease activity HflC (stomatin/prohibitin superfamily)
MEGLGVVIVLVLIAALVAYSFRVPREYERGVVFQLGRFWKVKGPGLVIVIPGIQQMVRVGLRTVTTDNDTLLSHMYRLFESSLSTR